jgi:hypothetical protein
MSLRCFRLPLLAALTTLALAGCAQKNVDDDEKEPVQLETAKSNLPRAAATAPQSDVAQAVTDDNGFAFDLYRAVREPGKNLLVSPHSISIAMAMTYAGARNQTEADLAGAMRFTLPQSQLHPALNTLDQALNSRGQGASGKDGLPFRLNVVNAAWGQTGYHFEQSYLDTLAVNYGAGLNLLDFGADPEAARGTINDWVSQQTSERIPELLPQGMKEVAACFGETVLRKVRPEQLFQEIAAVREKTSDRAVLRAMHYFSENSRVTDQVEALEKDDIPAFFRDVIASGRSSFMYLQNVYAKVDEQQLSLALALAESMLGSSGAWRVHGGGFAGTTLNFVPLDRVSSFTETMESAFGPHCCYQLDIRPEGAARIEIA